MIDLLKDIQQEALPPPPVPRPVTVVKESAPTPTEVTGKAEEETEASDDASMVTAASTASSKPTCSCYRRGLDRCVISGKGGGAKAGETNDRRALGIRQQMEVGCSWGVVRGGQFSLCGSLVRRAYPVHRQPACRHESEGGLLELVCCFCHIGGCRGWDRARLGHDQARRTEAHPHEARGD